MLLEQYTDKQVSYAPIIIKHEVWQPSKQAVFLIQCEKSNLIHQFCNHAIIFSS